jgi:hypothetical protein
VKGIIGPALKELGVIIVAPDSVRGNWSTSENEIFGWFPYSRLAGVGATRQLMPAVCLPLEALR